VKNDESAQGVRAILQRPKTRMYGSPLARAEQIL